jgi:hypothetical protein
MRFCVLIAALACGLMPATAAVTSTIPASSGTALDGRTVRIPGDLPAGVTILILGFTRDSSTATTDWEKRVRTSIATTPSIDYFDIAFLEDAPSFVRPLIVRAIRRQVPDAVRPHFLPLTSNEAAWKQVAGFTSSAPDAAYVLLIDRTGKIHWQTHQPLTSDRIAELSAAAHQLAASK